MKLNNFRTIHRVTADYELIIEWTGNGSNGSYTTWVTDGFTFQLDEKQQELVDNWIKDHASEANTWTWKLNEF